MKKMILSVFIFFVLVSNAFGWNSKQLERHMNECAKYEAYKVVERIGKIDTNKHQIIIFEVVNKQSNSKPFQVFYYHDKLRGVWYMVSSERGFECIGGGHMWGE